VKKKPIGVFDSGVGGLTVLKEIERLMPAEDIIYFGDTARVPYGNKSKSTIIKFSTENILFLLEKEVKIIVVACNTASSLALDYLKGIFSIPILGVIEAGVDRALEITKHRKIGIIGTRSTVGSRSYEKEILRRNKNTNVYSKACPLFVPLVEEGILKGKIIEQVIDMYLRALREKRIDTLILGCTHYPLLKREIAKYLKHVFIVDSAEEVALHTKEVLIENDILNQDRRIGEKEFYVTDEPKGFVKLAKLFLQRDIPMPRVVSNV
jgi:glutamate racemase